MSSQSKVIKKMKWKKEESIPIFFFFFNYLNGKHVSSCGQGQLTFEIIRYRLIKLKEQTVK